MPAAKRVVAAPAAVIHPKDVQKIKNLNGLIEFLGAELEWPLEVEADVVEQSFEIVPSRFVSPEQAKKLREGRVLQLRPFVSSQPWGIFVVEFAQPDVSITTLRQVLREQLEYRGKDSSLPSWAQEDLLFLCVTHDPKTNSYKQFTFAHFRRQKTESGERPAVLSTFGWEKGDTHLRTLCDYNLRALKYPTDLGDAQAWRTQWREAFDVEKVTQKFFEEYGKVFKSVEESIRGVAKGEERLYAQRLFNRLMFLYFLERKGWLKFEDKANYLRALWDKAEKNDENFLNDRLYWAFFSGLGNTLDDARGHDLQVLEGLRGHVPFLNGGLFDLVDPYDPRDRKGRPLVEIPNSEFGKILDLFESFNFTVEESTPQDVAVAVDPEMLGKVFEELVTGRHETGSYYTPRPVVAFMCREALKSFLAPVGEDAAALARFVDENDASELRNSEQVLEALKRVKVCDPACGSGAYLLGMMQELLRLREGLFVKGKKADPLTSYEKKLSIISHNLYGVDVDRFAVNIAMLRLWLSLVVDLDDNTPLDDIPALPNLNYKIACGDSLSAPDPQARDLTSEAYEEDAAILAELHDENLRQGIERKKGMRRAPRSRLKRTSPRWKSRSRRCSAMRFPRACIIGVAPSPKSSHRATREAHVPKRGRAALTSCWRTRRMCAPTRSSSTLRTRQHARLPFHSGRSTEPRCSRASTSRRSSRSGTYTCRSWSDLTRCCASADRWCSSSPTPTTRPNTRASRTNSSWPTRASSAWTSAQRFRCSTRAWPTPSCISAKARPKPAISLRVCGAGARRRKTSPTITKYFLLAHNWKLGPSCSSPSR
jgi:hypothetical protein